MMCERPFLKNPTACRIPVTHEERMACTPFPCGKCFPCRINKARVWTVRILLEAAAHKDNTFLTLTYNDDFLPRGDKEYERVSECSLDKKELQNFFKRLRKRIHPNRIRYFACGEYGDAGRPHYHAMIFGLPHTYKEIYERTWTERGIPIGFVDVGEITNYSARYITGYVMKNIKDVNEPWVRENYPWLIGREPEFMTASRRPGVGLEGLKIVLNQYNASTVTEKKIIRQFEIDSKMVPLGKYLTGKASEMQGITEELEEQEMYTWQDEIFAQFIKKGTTYYDNLKQWKEEKRKSQRARAKIFNQRRSL